jgi:glycosyltransferase involved in cell wall biosynthesis
MSARRAAPQLPVYYVDYVLDPSRPGASGLSDVVWDMAEELCRQGGEAHVFGPYGESPRPDSGAVLHRFRVPPPGYRNVVGHIAMVLSALVEIRRLRRPGILHAPEYLSTAILSILCRDPVVLTVPGNVFERVHGGVHAFDLMFTLALKAAARVSARRCARVVATSRDMALWWAWTGVKPSRLVAIPYGIDIGTFRRVKGARETLGIGPHAIVALSVGRLNVENGQEDLLRAFAAVADEFQSAELHVVGSGPMEANLRDAADEVGIASRVRWHSWLDRSALPLYYSAADLFVFTALSAGMPRVVFEAMACGAPVLATRVPGVEDHVEEGRTGYLVPPGDVRALATQLRAALSDRSREEIGARGASHARKHLAWSVVMGRLVDEVYRPLAAQTARGTRAALSGVGG